MKGGTYAAALPAAQRSGKKFNYASIDTNILGFLIEAVTGKSPRNEACAQL